MSEPAEKRKHEKRQVELSELMQYRNEDVVDAFCAALNVSDEDANDIFAEMLRFLWLCHEHGEDGLGVIDHPITIIDEMWHTFVLFTRDYHEFCFRYFGYFLHHVPTTESERHARQKLGEEDRERFRREKRERYEKIHDLLGREIFIKWYYQLPERYPVANIREMRKK